MTGGATGTGGRPGAPAPTDAAHFLERALQRTTEGILVVTVPAPGGRAERLLGGDDPAFFWTTPGAPVQVGLGAAHTITATGENRFRDLREEADALWSRLTIAIAPGATPLRPRLFGGLSFLPGPASARWRSFGDTAFLLPRLLYTVGDAGAALSLAINEDERDRRNPNEIVAEVEGLLARLAEPEASPTGSTAARGSGVTGHGTEPSDRAAWARAVTSIQDRIGTGRAEKIVAARSREVAISGGLDTGAVLRRMERESATAARFAFRLGGAVFLGATPERLVGRTNGEVRTEALAGSVAADSPEREERLLRSLKEEVEHDYVVRAIVEALEPLCERLDYPSEPRVQRLRHVLHLQTPFAGRLRQPVHVLELVERLHPTPAVGGWPTAEALAWIDGEEPGSRGWYAAPVGWFDDRGDGEFGVALRSALLHEGRAHLFAGAGIVHGSDADAEYDETELKLRTMLDALGLAS